MADVMWPIIESVSIVPNPVEASKTLRILVGVREIPLIPEWFFAGEIFAGEDV